ncbi:uncharacterized protein LOC126887847 [Diabrotica virgifera virgifera]|uniref:Uncharacterized protein LOC114333452 n=1 Tax=Diabrotica virgifera virgifera TaxID=50390 RepID=A0A6P7FWF5_DIAVI|nr:uncharacterized protein LOC126887847 [Diabrotica virgifera virgifera]
MGEAAENLNYDCNYNMFLAKIMLSNLSTNEDRQKAIKWMKKLTNCNRSIEEMMLRNDFMYYLVVNIQQGELQPPFTENPPSSALPNIAHLLPGGIADMETAEEERPSARGPMLYEKSPDGGAFLAAQPVPRCGAFCYLAVVARDSRNKE